ncbi:MAG: hypothetical protein LBT53_03790 [Puniceicoccales bacterium]|jgi:hypothetical protein|nr:hypothetical protein [Puniceicoccales bacterium]
MLTYKILKTITLTLVVFIMAIVALCAQEVPQPLVPFQNAKSYCPRLEAIRDAHKAKDIVAFYAHLKDLYIILNADKWTTLYNEGEDPNSVGYAAWDWWFYYAVQGRLLTEDEFKKNKQIDGFDLAAQSISFVYISDFRIGRLERMAEKFKFNMPAYRKVYVAYLRSIMSFFASSEIKLRKIEKKQKEEYAEFEKKVRKASSDRIAAAGGYIDMDIERLQVNGILYGKYYESLQTRRRISDCQFEQHCNRDEYVKTLVDAYPRDAAQVHEAIMSAGCESKAKCRDWLLRAVGRSKETEYLYRGLPKENKTSVVP